MTCFFFFFFSLSGLYRRNEKKTFTPERLVATIMSDLKIIAEADHGAKVTDSVISVPVFFTDPQRRAMVGEEAFTLFFFFGSREILCH